MRRPAVDLVSAIEKSRTATICYLVTPNDFFNGLLE
jgi:hypothetical protein